MISKNGYLGSEKPRIEKKPKWKVWESKASRDNRVARNAECERVFRANERLYEQWRSRYVWRRALYWSIVVCLTFAIGFRHQSWALLNLIGCVVAYPTFRSLNRPPQKLMPDYLGLQDQALKAPQLVGCGGFVAGMIAGAQLGGGIGLVGGPLGGIAGTVPGALVGGFVGLFGGRKVGKAFESAPTSQANAQSARKKKHARVGRWAGFAGGLSSGALIGSGIGLAAGPLGAIAGTIPGALIGGVCGFLGGEAVGEKTSEWASHKPL